jgi:hypothetical protein
MNLLRTLLLDNLGLKLVALLLAVLVYLNVYTDRPATMIVSFPIQVVDLPESLSLAGSAPAAVQAELRGTAKQLIRLRVTEPPVKVSLAGVGVGHFERALGVEDLPLPAGTQVQLDRLVSPRTIELQVDRKISRLLRVAPTIDGQPAPTVIWDGTFETDPARHRDGADRRAGATRQRAPPAGVGGGQARHRGRQGRSAGAARLVLHGPRTRGGARAARAAADPSRAGRGGSSARGLGLRDHTRACHCDRSSARRLGAEALAEVHATWHGARLRPAPAGARRCGHRTRCRRASTSTSILTP